MTDCKKKVFFYVNGLAMTLMTQGINVLKPSIQSACLQYKLH